MTRVARFGLCSITLLCLIVLLWAVGLLGAQQGRGVTPASRYQIAYATYLGGSGWDQAREVIPYPDGSVLIGAQVASSNMPTTEGAVQAKYAGDDPALGHGGVYGGDCYLARVSAEGSKVLAATFFGGSKQERNVYGMALDAEGNVVITSSTRSPDLPTTPDSFQPKFGGGASDWMVAKLSGDLTRLLWCTYVGGSDDDSPRGGLALDAQGNVYVVGGTSSPNFPMTSGALQTRRNGPQDSAIVKLKPDGSGAVFSTLLGGASADPTIVGARVDKAGNVFGGGHTQSADFPVTPGAAQTKLGGQSDCCIVKVASDGAKLLYATYLGGTGNEFAEHQLLLAPDGSVLLTGSAGSSDFPTTPGAFQRTLKGETDGFLTKLSADGTRFVFSTLFGGSGRDFWLMPTLDAEGNILVVGQTGSRDLPVTPEALQRSFGGGENDGALAIFSPDGSRLLYSTYLGGAGDDMIRSLALGPRGEVYLVGHTSSADFPATPNALQTKFGGGTGDAFVVKLVR